LSESGSDDHVVLLTVEQELQGRAIRVCKDYGITSPRMWQRIHLQAREEAVASMKVYGSCELDEDDDGFEDHFMGALTLLMSVQPGSQGTTPPTLPPKSPRRESNHRMPKEDAIMPATTGVGIMTQMQDLHPAASCTREDNSRRMSMSSINIVVPSDIRQPPGLSTIIEDPNIAGAIAGLVAPRQTGETTQKYEQCHAAAGCYQGSPAPAFFGQAGEGSEQQMEQDAPPNIKVQLEPEEELLVLLPKKKLKRFPMAEKLEDRIVYQWLCNNDLSKKSGSWYTDQEIAFSTDGKVLDEMKRLYQSSLKAAAAPGDDELDEPSDPIPWRGDPPPQNPKQKDGSRSHRSGSGKGPASFGGGPPGYPDDEGNGGDGSDDNSHHSRRSNDQGGCPDHNQHWRYSVPAAVHPRYNTPGVMEAVEHHCNHMHERLLQLIREHISVHLSIPEGTKLRQMEHSSVGKYEGSFKFGDLEKWLTDLIVLFEVSMYGSQDHDKERVLSTLEFLDGEARKWFHHHVVNVHHACLRWTFEEVIMGLYDRFVQPLTMQDVHKEFLSASYNAATGIQGYYDILMDHAQNMVIYPDDYQIMERFLNGILDDIQEKVFDCCLSPEVNTINDLVACAKAIEITKKTMAHYRKRTPTTAYSSPRVAPHRTTMATKPKEATYTHRPQFESRSREPRRDDDNCRRVSRPTMRAKFEKLLKTAPQNEAEERLPRPPRHKGKGKEDALTEEDFPHLRQQWHDEFMDMVNGTHSQLPPWREVNHEIHLVDNNKRYKYFTPCCPNSLRDELHAKINRYVNTGWWEPRSVKQAALLLCIPKKDGKLRTVVDARQQNDNMVKDVMPLPDQEVIRKDIARVKYRSKIDLTDAYEQVCIRVEDVEKNAFATITGMFVSHVMWIGDCNVPATFQ